MQTNSLFYGPLFKLKDCTCISNRSERRADDRIIANLNLEKAKNPYRNLENGDTRFY